MTEQLVRAVKLLNAGQRDAARAICDELLRTDGDNPQVVHLSGAIAAQSNQHQEAIAAFERAVKLREDWPEALCNLAAAYRSVGRFEESAEQLHRALRHDDRYARAYFFLSQIASFHDRHLLDRILAVLKRPQVPQADQCHLHFAAGKICDDLGCFDEAFYHFALANAARRAKFDPVEHAHFVNRMVTASDQSQSAARQAGDDARHRPIFVVGMPRSGTSLVEQILASHPQVHGAGELPDMPSIAQTLPKYAEGEQEYPECLKSLRDRVYQGFAQAYLGRLDQLTPDGHGHVIDKNPGNFVHLAMITLMFPRATIIHCVRHPLATCLSCYFQNFASRHDYTFDQVHLGFYYAQYERLMAHWHHLLPQRVLDFSYERIVTQPEEATRELLQWCGLEWDANCLSPHQNARPVATASAWEVRQPIYRSSLERWRNYEQFLGPLRNAMDLARAGICAV